MTKAIDSLQKALDELLVIAQQSDKVEFRAVFKILAGRGLAILLMLFSLPFCLPIAIPGLSTAPKNLYKSTHVENATPAKQFC